MQTWSCHKLSVLTSYYIETNIMKKYSKIFKTFFACIVSSPFSLSLGTVVFTAPFACFTWNKALQKTDCVKSAGNFFVLWGRQRKKPLEYKVKITDSICSTKNKYRLKPQTKTFPYLLYPLCLSQYCLFFLANFILLFLITALTGSYLGLVTAPGCNCGFRKNSFNNTTNERWP